MCNQTNQVDLVKLINDLQKTIDCMQRDLTHVCREMYDMRRDFHHMIRMYRQPSAYMPPDPYCRCCPPGSVCSRCGRW